MPHRSSIRAPRSVYGRRHGSPTTGREWRRLLTPVRPLTRSHVRHSTVRPCAEPWPRVRAPTLGRRTLNNDPDGAAPGDRLRSPRSSPSATATRSMPDRASELEVEWAARCTVRTSTTAAAAPNEGAAHRGAHARCTHTCTESPRGASGGLAAEQRALAMRHDQWVREGCATSSRIEEERAALVRSIRRTLAAVHRVLTPGAARSGASIARRAADRASNSPSANWPNA